LQEDLRNFGYQGLPGQHAYADALPCAPVCFNLNADNEEIVACYLSRGYSQPAAVGYDLMLLTHGLAAANFTSEAARNQVGVGSVLRVTLLQQWCTCNLTVCGSFGHSVRARGLSQVWAGCACVGPPPVKTRQAGCEPRAQPSRYTVYRPAFGSVLVAG
jgi:hypothetical protein